MERSGPEEGFACAFVMHSDQIAIGKSEVSTLVSGEGVSFSRAYVQFASVAVPELEENSTSSVSAATNVDWATNSFGTESPSTVFRR